MALLRAYAIGVLLITSYLSPLQAYQVVLDGEDTSYYTLSPAWSLDKTGEFLGNYKFSVTGPGTGSNKCVWDIDSIPAGTYDVEFYVDNGNFAANAQYIVEHDGGVTTLTKSQNFVGKGWHPLGTFNFDHAGRITQTDYWTGAGISAIADALRITYQGTPPLPDPATSTSPEVSLVIDDLGALNPNNSGTYTYQLFNDPNDISYAIIPGLQYSTTVLQKAQTLGKQTILHQPMQYIGQPDSNPSDPTRLYISMNSSQILSVLNSNLAAVAPYVWGVNNHQGSRFSQYRTGLEVALEDLKSRDMFFLDSRTISDSVAYDIGREKGMLIAERDLFVDGNTVAATKALIESVGERAKYAPNFNHVMICHQRDNTVPGIFQAMTSLQTMGVTVKRIERNLHYIVETDKIPLGATVQADGPWTSTTADMISHECFNGDALQLANGTSGSVTFKPNLPKNGMYRVYAGNQFSKVSIISNAGPETKLVPATANRHNWIYIGTYPFNAGTAGAVRIETNPAVIGNTTADAIKFTYDGDLPPSQVFNWNQY